MIDFVRVHLPLSESQKYDLEKFQIVGLETGELKKKPFGYMGNMRYKETDNYIVLSGSLHSYFNDHVLKNEKANSNDFSYHSLVSCIDILSERLNVDWNNAKLTQLEFGFNIRVNQPIEEIIDSIKLHKELEPTNNYSTTKRNSKFFNRYEYWIKIYDKGKHYRIPESKILRIEKKFYSTQLKKLGIKTLNDLKDKQKLKTLYKALLKRFDELLIIDPCSVAISDKDRLKVLMRSAGGYWKALRRKKSRTTARNHYKDLNRVIGNYGLDATKLELRTMIIDKFNELLEVEEGLHIQAI